MCYSAVIRQHNVHLGLEDVVRSEAAFQQHERRYAADPKRFPQVGERIYPHSYAEVVHIGDKGQLIASPMRYSAFTPPHFEHPSRYTTFNARRDNLTSPFWSSAFHKHHGAVVLRSFFEWVAVADLLKAGVVTLSEVKSKFARQAAERRAKVEAAGKPYKPTPTELKPVSSRKTIIEFSPSHDLLVPVIFNTIKREDGAPDMGFAIVTDEPPSEVSAAGHDRCPVWLTEQAIAIWLRPLAHSAAELVNLLSERPSLRFQHALDLAA